MKRLLETVLILMTCGRACANYGDADIVQVRPGALSTNWFAAIKEAIPSAPSMGESNFQSITNLLCRESRRGNIAAQGLWGFFVLVQSRAPEEAATGLQLLRNSATNGFVPAMLNLGVLFEGGEYVQRDYSEAFHWFTEAAANNNPEGLLQLGGCYHYGLGTPCNLAKAADFYRRAAELTNYVAMKSLG
ncbi:MAG: tetratricopeptide repeat protein, partial [Limisphaerales bacterium]